jgi:hypothetical protein
MNLLVTQFAIPPHPFTSPFETRTFGSESGGTFGIAEPPVECWGGGGGKISVIGSVRTTARTISKARGDSECHIDFEGF